MEILTRTELRLRFDEIKEKVLAGDLFIHPTDTIYGIGCNALDGKAVAALRQLKERPTTPLSVWVPSLEWVRNNCVVSKNAEKWLQQLPGPFTLIIKLQNKKAVAKEVMPEVATIGVRYPDHWFGKIVEELGIPIVTTSANKKGQPFMTRVENLDPDIEKGVEFMLYEGEKEARPSKIVHVEKEEIFER